MEASRAGSDAALAAIVVLGCGVLLGNGGKLRDCALARRVEAAARLYTRRGGRATVVVASGGRRWNGAVEADVMARELTACGVPDHSIVRERCSLSTRDNARFTAGVLGRRGIRHAAIVTCDWHVQRAVALFRREGIVAEAVGASSQARWARRAWRWGQERVLTWMQTRS